MWKCIALDATACFSPFLSTLLKLVPSKNFFITCLHYFYIIKVLIFHWHLSYYFSVYFINNVKMCTTAWLCQHLSNDIE